MSYFLTPATHWSSGLPCSRTIARAELVRAIRLLITRPLLINAQDARPAARLTNGVPAGLASLAPTTAAFELAYTLFLVAALDSDPIVEALELACQAGQRLVSLLQLGIKMLHQRF